MFFRRNKLRRVKRGDLVEKIIDHERERDEIENSLLNQEQEIKALYDKGYHEKSQQARLLYATKIKRMKESSANGLRRLQFINYNINILERLKNALDEQQFADKKSDDFLNKILADKKSLSAFLSSSINKRRDLEDNMVNANHIFDEMDSVKGTNEEIYGVTPNEEDILAQFERGAMLNDELPEDESEPEKRKKEEA